MIGHINPAAASSRGLPRRCSKSLSCPQIFIERLKWMSAPVFMELFALGQCLPGPTSTQVSFAIGLIKKGIPGGILSGMLFQYPGLVMMSLIGWAADNLNFQIDVVKGFVAGIASRTKV